jgi:hypothetical protein
VYGVMTAYLLEGRRRCVELNGTYKLLAVTHQLRGTTSFSCTVINVSEHGALLQVNTRAVPDDFYLVVGESPDQRITCSVVGRAGNQVNVRFVSSCAGLSAAGGRNKRAFPRWRTHKEGKLILGDDIIDCVIKDESDRGALVRTSTFTPVADKLFLFERKSGKVYECQVRWRKGDLIGLHFIGWFNIRNTTNPRFARLTIS